MSPAVSVFKVSVQSVCLLQQHTIEVSFGMTGLPCHWLLWQTILYLSNCSSLQLGIVGRFWHVQHPSITPSHDNPVDWDLAT